MPKLKRSIRQRGSVLVTVLGLTAVMTSAAAGYLTLISSRSSLGADVLTNAQAFYAAESGLHLGLRWAKGYPVPVFSMGGDPLWAKDLVLTLDEFGNPGWAVLDGIKVKVIANRTGDGQGGRRWISSYAKKGDGLDVVKLTVQLDGASPSGTPVPDYNESDFKQWIKNWADSVFVGT